MNSLIRLLLALTLALGFSYLMPMPRLRSVSAQSTGLSGSYGLLLTKAGAAMETDLALVVFDGAGNVSGSVTATSCPAGQFTIGSSGPPPSNCQSQNLQLQGTYSVGANGAGSLTITSNGISQSTTYAMTVTDGGAGLQLLSTSSPDNSLSSGTGRRQ
jgi:hypothetical protein